MAAKTDELRAKLDKLNNGEYNSGVTTGMVTRKTSTIEISIGELAAACDAKKDHPIAKAWRKTVLENTKKGVKGEPDELLANNKVIVDRTDLEALLDNKEVVVVSLGEEVDGGFSSTVLSKEVGDTIKPAPSPENFDRPKTSKTPANSGS